MNECLPAVLQLGRIQPCSSNSFSTAGGVPILAYLEMSARRAHFWRKAGESSSVEQILEIASQVVRMLCRATHLPCGERQFYTRRGNSTIRFSKRRIQPLCKTRMIYVVAYKVVKTSCMDLVAGHLEPTKGKFDQAASTKTFIQPLHF
jgi:hypothetical protein